MNVRKIKECICDSLEKFATISGSEVLPIGFGWFLRNMALILLADSKARLCQDVPVIDIGGYKSGGKAEEPTISAIIRVLTHHDMIRGTGQSMQLQGFLDWILDQDEPDELDDDSDLVFWYSQEFLGEKWNEYAMIARERDEPTES